MTAAIGRMRSVCLESRCFPMRFSSEGRLMLTLRCTLLLAGLLLSAGCGLSAGPTAYGDGFPVVKPFDLTQAGGRVEADFELPEALEHWKDGRRRHRPVFIGFRSPGQHGRPDIREGDTTYLDWGDMPLRIQLWRIEDGQRVKVVLHELQQEIQVPGKRDRFWYEPQPQDVYIRHNGAGGDVEELEAAGYYDMSKTYLVWSAARIIPPTPGRYHLQVESLQDHPAIDHLQFELMISHYSRRGIE